jgi:hypothetical protein
LNCSRKRRRNIRRSRCGWHLAQSLRPGRCRLHALRPGGEIPGTEERYKYRPKQYRRDDSAVYLMPAQLKTPAAYTFKVPAERIQKPEILLGTKPIDYQEMLTWLQTHDIQDVYDKTRGARKFRKIPQVLARQHVPVTEQDLIRRPDIAAFDEWYAKHAARLGLNPDPYDPQHYYDYRAAFAAGAEPDDNGHWPSKFKLEGHPNLIVDGIDTRTGKPEKKAELTLEKSVGTAVKKAATIQKSCRVISPP